MKKLNDAVKEFIENTHLYLPKDALEKFKEFEFDADGDTQDNDAIYRLVNPHMTQQFQTAAHWLGKLQTEQPKAPLNFSERNFEKYKNKALEAAEKANIFRSFMYHIGKNVTHDKNKRIAKNLPKIRTNFTKRVTDSLYI